MLEQEMAVVDADAIATALRVARRTLAAAFEADLMSTYASLASDAPYEVNAEQVGARRLRNTCLGYLATLKTDMTTNLCLEQFRSAECMTDRVGALLPLSNCPGAARDEALSAFYERAKSEHALLVINKWFQIQAISDTSSVLDDVKALINHEAFDGNNPNVVRSLVNTFAGANPAAFHAKDGKGYAFIADQVIDIDKRNSQLAARLAGSFNTWRRHDEARQALQKAQLERIAAEASSNDVKEIVSKALAA